MYFLRKKRPLRKPGSEIRFIGMANYFRKYICNNSPSFGSNYLSDFVLGAVRESRDESYSCPTHKKLINKKGKCGKKYINNDHTR